MPATRSPARPGPGRSRGPGVVGVVARTPRRPTVHGLLVIAVLVGLLAGAGVEGTAAPPAGEAQSVEAPVYRPPVEGRVLRGFDPPGHRYGAGHRGVDLDAAPGAEVVAASAGTVVHAGAVAGTVWVSVDHPDGVRTSYGPLTDRRVEAGVRVRGGQRLGRLAAGGHGPDGRDRGLHWGARRDGAYLDPLGLLAVRVRPSLVGHVDGPGSPVTAGADQAPPPAPSPDRPRRLARAGPPAVP